MFCSKCGNELEKGVKFCPKCGANTANEGVKKVTKELSKDEIIAGDTKVFKVVSYLGLLWILGIFCGSKYDEKVRFHVGQGIILTIALVVLSIVASILNAIIFSTCAQISFFGINAGLNTLGKILLAVVNLACYGSYIFYVVLGIINAVKDNKKELPLIGKLAFYK